MALKKIFYPMSIILGFIIFSMFILPINTFPAKAKDVVFNEYLLKSVFIERFSRFVTWPESCGISDSQTSFVLGIVGKNPFGELLDTLYANRPIKTKKVDIRYIKSVESLKNCNMIFMGKMNRKKFQTIIEQIEYTPVLTISDNPGYGQQGVHINMFIKDEQIRFEINNRAARTAGLHISHLLLKSARIIETVQEKK